PALQMLDVLVLAVGDKGSRHHDGAFQWRDGRPNPEAADAHEQDGKPEQRRQPEVGGDVAMPLVHARPGGHSAASSPFSAADVATELFPWPCAVRTGWEAG